VDSPVWWSSHHLSTSLGEKIARKEPKLQKDFRRFQIFFFKILILVKFLLPT
jgi:hypothetical protein